MYLDTLSNIIYLMKNNFVKDILDKLNQSYESNREYINDSVSKLSDEIGQILQDDGRRIFVIAIGGNAKFAKGLEWDFVFNVGIEKDKIIIVNPGESFRNYIDGWESFSSDAPIATIELMQLGLKSDDLVIGLSSSGNNNFVCGALNYAKDLGCKTAIITNGATEDVIQVDNMISMNFNDKYLMSNLKSLEGTLSLKLMLDSVFMGALVKSGRIYNDQLIYRKFNSEESRKECLRILNTFVNLGDEELLDLFNKSGQSQSVAIVMNKYGICKDEAIEIIKKNNYNFNEIMK